MTQKDLRFKIDDKINLWEIPGFINFIQDLSEYVGTERDVAADVEVIRRLYKAELKRIAEERRKNKYKQGNLGL